MNLFTRNSPYYYLLKYLLLLLKRPVYHKNKRTCSTAQISELTAVTALLYANKSLLTTVADVWVVASNSGVAM